MYKSESHANRLSARHVTNNGSASKILDAFFDPNEQAVRSFREAYIMITGDKRVTGRLNAVEPTTYREAIGAGTLGGVLGDSINRAMLREYHSNPGLGIWRKVAKVGQPINDFRTQNRFRIGGYGDLPIVAESAPYNPLTTPSSEMSSYAVSKRGGTEIITLEAIVNDDVGVLQTIPKKLAEAAARTLARFVLNFLKDNPIIYDSDTLFSVAHNNLGSAPLSAASMSVARAAMIGQTEPGSDYPIGVEPASLLVPADLEEVAFNLFQRDTNNDKTFVERMALDIVRVWDWTDADDWVVAANPEMMPCIEMGFLNGQEDPEIFLQELPTSGSMFSNDELKYKIRHIYGGTVTDFRGLYKSVVV
ncbi:MAG: hypothetical protein AB2810_15975 [Candidatus Thiodiazotropha endolucinida]